MTELTDAQQLAVAELKKLNQEISRLTKRSDELKERLRTELKPGTHVWDGKAVIEIRETRRFSADLAMELLPPDQLSYVTSWVVDRELAASKLPPDTYKACMQIAGKPTVRVL